MTEYCFAFRQRSLFVRMAEPFGIDLKIGSDSHYHFFERNRFFEFGLAFTLQQSVHKGTAAKDALIEGIVLSQGMV